MNIDDRSAALIAAILAAGALVETAAYFYCKNHGAKAAEPRSAEQKNAIEVLKWASASSWLAVVGVIFWFGPQIIAFVSVGKPTP